MCVFVCVFVCVFFSVDILLMFNVIHTIYCIVLISRGSSNVSMLALDSNCRIFFKLSTQYCCLQCVLYLLYNRILIPLVWIVPLV